MYCLHIKNIPDSWDNAKLKEVFGAFGEMTALNMYEEMDILKDDSKQRFAYVTFASCDAAVKCVKELHDTDVRTEEDKAKTQGEASNEDAKKLYVQQCTPKQEKNPDDGFESAEENNDVLESPAENIDSFKTDSFDDRFEHEHPAAKGTQPKLDPNLHPQYVYYAGMETEMLQKKAADAGTEAAMLRMQAAAFEAEAQRLRGQNLPVDPYYIIMQMYGVSLDESGSIVGEEEGAAKFEKFLDGYNKGYTTVMWRNLPNNVTRAKILEVLETTGFIISFDFLYVPIDFVKKSNLGYAFINLVTTADATRFWAFALYFNDWGCQSSKMPALDWGQPLQGLAAHVERYRNSPVMHHEVEDCHKPLLYYNGVRQEFPPPTKAISKPKGKSAAKPGAGKSAAKES